MYLLRLFTVSTSLLLGTFLLLAIGCSGGKAVAEEPAYSVMLHTDFSFITSAKRKTLEAMKDHQTIGQLVAFSTTWDETTEELAIVVHDEPESTHGSITMTKDKVKLTGQLTKEGDTLKGILPTFKKGETGDLFMIKIDIFK